MCGDSRLTYGIWRFPNGGRHFGGDEQLTRLVIAAIIVGTAGFLVGFGGFVIFTVFFG
jgi:hypothetical protein